MSQVQHQASSVNSTAACGRRVARGYAFAALGTIATGVTAGLVQGVNVWVGAVGGVIATAAVVFAFVALRASRDSNIVERLVDADKPLVAAQVSAPPPVLVAPIAAPVIVGPSDAERTAVATAASLQDQLASYEDTINALTTVMVARAEGDLGKRADESVQGPLGMLARQMNVTSRLFGEFVGRVNDVAHSLSNGASDIARGSQDLSSRTEQQASSLEETAATMEEFTATVKNNADNARQADQLASGASQIAAKGGDTVRKVVTTMNEISESSKRIQEIISVIDGIAFQTNILALNAAVEAARAGEQGRGFAVVAAEVRNLAQRSAAAAKEIKTLITESVEKVGDGTRFVDAAGKQIEEVVVAVKRVSDIISEITAASVEQSSGIEQVSQAVGQMDQATQQNAALVEESTASAETMKGQASQLVQLVATYAGRPVTSSKGASGAAKPVTPRSSPQNSFKAGAVKPMSPTARPAPSYAPATAKEYPVAKAKRVANSRSGDDEWEEF